MRRCVSLAGCDLWVESEIPLCYYHLKKASGLIGGSRKPRRELRWPADVLSVEQEEMAEILLKMGASRDQVRTALFSQVGGHAEGPKAR